MTLYPFVDEKTGLDVDLNFPMGRAPKIGDTVVRGGAVLRRVPGHQEISPRTDDIFWNYQIGRETQAAKDADFHTASGVPGWKNRASARTWAEKRTDQGLEADFEG
jgi:hypothetical protein